MSGPQWRSQTVPAQLAFLAIYNPSLGPTDDTFRKQLLFYYARTTHEARASARKAQRSQDLSEDEARAEENEQLRQIGLAQGMVDFARSFSNGQPVDSVETEKSRVVLRELEPGWWILASIDLTKLPSVSAQTTPASTRSKADPDPTAAIEYSSRELSPPQLLLAQLDQAHHIFSLHHGPSLDDLFARLPRDKFCNTLHRFWTKFARQWDVLLHGNPAVDVFGGIKLASGGELGFGVGEEEWGSGEREVLEDLIRRTEGLIDMVVSRFGDQESLEGEKQPEPAAEDSVPWLGGGQQPLATDGIVFGGTGAMSRSSLRNVSLWMRHIYTYGDHAFAVRDNPLRDGRTRKRRKPPTVPVDDDEDAESSHPQPATEPSPEHLRQKVQQKEALKQNDTTGHPFLELMPQDKRPQIHPRVASQDYASTPEQTPTPPPDDSNAKAPPEIAAAAEEALQKVTKGLDQGSSATQTDPNDGEPATTMGIPDQYMKYLTFGLSTLGKQPSKRPSSSSSPDTAASSSDTARTSAARKGTNGDTHILVQSDQRPITRLDPIPDGEAARSKIALQRSQENAGHFLIGLKGDLQTAMADKDAGLTDGSLRNESDGTRTVLRTVHLEVAPKDNAERTNEEPVSAPLDSSEVVGLETSINQVKRVRILLYVRRPFMYCLLFEDRTSSLQWTDFYINLHRDLGPIHKPLLSSTNVAKVAERVEASHGVLSEAETASATSTTNKLPPKSGSASPIFDLIYDPHLLTLHASIPNIPLPGTLAAEGFSSSNNRGEGPSSVWTRVDALNVHHQILDTLVSVKANPHEIERTSKTNKGWWIVWLKILPSSHSRDVTEGGTNDQGENESTATLTGMPPMHSSEAKKHSDSRARIESMHRTAFLVRKASDTAAVSKPSGSSSRAMSGMLNAMTLGLAGRSEEDSTGGASAGWGPGALAGGIGVDARKYVEGLLSLNR